MRTGIRSPGHVPALRAERASAASSSGLANGLARSAERGKYTAGVSLPAEHDRQLLPALVDLVMVHLERPVCPEAPDRRRRPRPVAVRSQPVDADLGPDWVRRLARGKLVFRGSVLRQHDVGVVRRPVMARAIAEVVLPRRAQALRQLARTVGRREHAGRLVREVTPPSLERDCRRCCRRCRFRARLARWRMPRASVRPAAAPA